MVEFALIMPILFMVLFGVVDYGLFFDNSLSVRHGVREGARQGVVETAPGPSCASQSGYVAQLACETRSLVGPVTGDVYVKVFYDSWSTGETLTVCSAVRTEGLIGLVPFPDDGYATAQTRMSIEVTDPVPTGPNTYEDTLPTGRDWSWCA